MKNNYNDDLKYSQLIKDLKELPKEKTADNFEHNLMVRIQNQNFGVQEDPKPAFAWFRFLAPSALVVTVIILIFIFLPASQQTLNPTVSPALTQETASVKENVPDKKSNPAELNRQISPNLNELRAGRNESALPAAKGRLPFNGTRSISVDEFVSGARANQRELNGGNVVNSGDNTAPDGFFISSKPDQKMLNKYRATVDSLKKAQIKADSLKKIQKMP